MLGFGSRSRLVRKESTASDRRSSFQSEWTRERTVAIADRETHSAAKLLMAHTPHRT